VKVLLDECVDWRLARDIPGHSVKTARQMGWTIIKNGELLALAAAEFDVLSPWIGTCLFSRSWIRTRSQ